MGKIIRNGVIYGGGGGGSGGGGGHNIQNSEGEELTSRPVLQFFGAEIEDDAENNATVVKLSGGSVEFPNLDIDENGHLVGSKGNRCDMSVDNDGHLFAKLY